MSVFYKLKTHMRNASRQICFRAFSVLFLSCITCASLAQAKAAGQNSKTDDALIEQFVNSRGRNIIVFDSSNIKQFWIDKSVSSQNGNIEIQLMEDAKLGNKSIPLKIQLANVNEAQDCKVEILTDTQNTGFAVTDGKSKKLSEFTDEEDFIQYSVLSSTFHLENTQDMTFFLDFYSKASSVSIKKIIISFSNNNDSLYLAPGGVSVLNKKDIIPHSSIKSFEQIDSEKNAFSVTGKTCYVYFRKNILLSGGSVSNSVTLKNNGTKPVNVSIGYCPFTKEKIQVNNRVTPYGKDGKIVKVVSSEANSNKIIVDAYPEWAKNCFVALNAKEDLSDFPNCSLVDGAITEVNKTNSGQAEIILSKPLKSVIEKGTSIRIQSPLAQSFVCTISVTLQPGEEKTLESKINKNEQLYQFSQKEICRGIYYVQPILASSSSDPQEDATLIVKDFKLSN